MTADRHSPSIATNTTLLKQINYARILELLRCRAPMTRAEIARSTGLTRSTVTVITAELISQSLIRESGEIIAPPGGGRPGVGLSLNPDGAFFIGAAIEYEQLTVVQLNLAAQVVNRIQAPLIGSREPEIVLSQLVQLIGQVQQSDPTKQERSRGIGLAIQATMNLAGVVIYSPFLQWVGVDLRRYLQPHIQLPLFVDNDANAAALAEVYLGSAMHCHSLLYLLINKGIGAGIVLNNRIFRGAYGTAGEVGAILPMPTGCGDLGTFVGREALLQNYRQRGGQAGEIGDLVAHFHQDEPLARAVVSEWVQILGWGLINLANILNPERIAIGGPLAVLVPHVKEELDSMLRDCVPGNGGGGFFSDPKARFDVSAFGEDAAVIGGAVLAYQSLFQVPDLVLLAG